MARPRQHGERIVTAIRVPVDLHARLVEVCDERDITINGLMVKATQHYLDNVMRPLPAVDHTCGQPDCIVDATPGTARSPE